MRKIILAFLIFFNLGSFAQVKTAEDDSETFVGRSLNELDRLAVNIGEDIKELFSKKRDYKPFTNNHEKPIKSHIIPPNYIQTKAVSSTAYANFKNFQIEKEVRHELYLNVMYPRITPNKGYLSFQVGDNNYKRYINDISKENIEYIKLISTDSANCYIKKYTLLPKRRVKRHYSFVLDHSGSMGDQRANKLQIAVFNAIKKNTLKNKNDNTYSIHKFDGEGNIVHLITTKIVDEIREVLLPTKGLIGFGNSTAIKDALNQAIDTIAKDKESESKLIILFTDGYTNTDEIPLTLTDVIRKSIDNNVSIAPVGFGSNVDDNYLRQIAYFAGGNMYKIYHEDEFDQFFENIFLDIDLNYEIAFSPCKFGDELTIELKLKGLEKPLIGQTFFATPIRSGYTIDLNILFDPASSKINEDKYGENLDQVSQLLKSRSDLNIIIEGHTDKVGRESYNKDLSLKRAEAVKKYFVNLGISENRIETKGFGWSMPAYPYINGEKENALNRRITLKIK